MRDVANEWARIMVFEDLMHRQAVLSMSLSKVDSMTLFHRNRYTCFGRRTGSS